MNIFRDYTGATSPFSMEVDRTPAIEVPPTANNPTPAINIPNHLSHHKSAQTINLKCTVPNCGRILKRSYNKRCRLCPEHMAATELQLEGADGCQRFCQKCGKVHPLAEFEGLKRSCRVGLERHNIRQRALRSLHGSSSSPSSSGVSLGKAADTSSDGHLPERQGPNMDVSTDIERQLFSPNVKQTTEYGVFAPASTVSPSRQSLLTPVPVATAPPTLTLLPQPKQTPPTFLFDEFLYSSIHSDDSLVDWLLSGLDCPDALEAKPYTPAAQHAELPPIVQLPINFFI